MLVRILRGVIALWLWLSAGLICARAQAPAMTHLFPVAGQQGTTVEVTAYGKLGAWPPQVWVDAPGIDFKPRAKAPLFDVEVAKDAAPGPHAVRFFNAQGASGPRVFIVSPRPELLEKEPNDRWAAPQKIDGWPATINGRLEKAADADCYAVTLKKGQTLVARVEAYVLASTVDVLLRVLDTTGAELAFNHDARTLDPFLAWTAPADGTYIVQVLGFAYPATSAVGLFGGEGAIYRLHLTAGPYVQATLPLVLPKGQREPQRTIGWNLAPGAKLDTVETDRPAATSELPEEIEAQPPEKPQPVPVPGAVTGQILQADEEDRYTFTPQKQQSYELRVTAAGAGSLLDAWVAVESAAGKELARADDAPTSRDPVLTWRAPSDEPVTVAIGDLTHRGGEHYYYRLAITPAVPGVEATIASPGCTIQPGKTTELKVQVQRVNGHKAKLQLDAKNLPARVSTAPVEVPEKNGEISFTLKAEPAAAAGNQPFQLVVREVEGGREYEVRHLLTVTTENNGVPSGYTTLLLPALSNLWITVLGK